MLELIFIEITYRPHVLGSSLEVFFLAGHSVSLTNPDVTEASAAGKSLRACVARCARVKT